MPVDGAGVAVVASEGAPGERVVGYKGLATCGSVWACPRCSAVIGARRAQEIRDGLSAWQQSGGAVVLLTLTMRHHHGQALASLWKGLATAWRKLMSHRAWKQFKQAAGVKGVIRGVEVTHGEAGWHVHVHALVLLDPVESVRWQDVGGTPEFEAHFAALASRQPVIRAWRDLLAGCGFDAVADAQDMRPVAVEDARDHVANYLTKQTWDAADELARSASKRGRGSSRTPMQLLHDFVSTGEADDLDLWHEWECGSRGQRQMTWSRGLKQALGIDGASDQEVAEHDTEDEQRINDRTLGDSVLTVLSGKVWACISKAGLECALLELVEGALDPTAALQAFFKDRLGATT